MGRVLALPCDQQAAEHADWATVTDLPQLSIYTQLLQQEENVKVCTHIDIYIYVCTHIYICIWIFMCIYDEL